VEVPLNDLQNHNWAIQEVQNLNGKEIISGMMARLLRKKQRTVHKGLLQLLD